MPFCTRRPNQRKKHSHCVPPKRGEVCIDECSRFYPGRDDEWNKKFSVDLFIPTKVSQHWKTFDKTLTSCLPLAVCLRSQKLRSNAKMQNMGEEVSGCWGYQREGVRFYENLRICKCFFELKSNFILTVLSLDPLTRKSPFLSIAQTGPSCPISILCTKKHKAHCYRYNHNISCKLLLLCTV